MVFIPLSPNWADDIRNACFPKPAERTKDGAVSMSIIDTGARDGDGRPINAPEPTVSRIFDAVNRPAGGTGSISAAQLAAEVPTANALSIGSAKLAVDNWIRVVAYQFQVAVKPFVNAVTQAKLEETFQENLKKLIEANTKHVAQMYEGIIELRVRETIDQRAKNLADLAIMQERSHHKLANLRASIDSVVAREKNAIRQQYVGFRERMRDEVISEVREELTDKLEELFDDMEE